jgi:hypothetical protein
MKDTKLKVKIKGDDTLYDLTKLDFEIDIECYDHNHGVHMDFNWDMVEEIIPFKGEESLTETPEAKLRNLLTPIYSLAMMMVTIDENPEIKPLAIDQAKQVMMNKNKIRSILLEIENK